MSSLDDLSRHAQRYHLKRARSNSPGSSSSASSSSGYGSILSDDEAEEKNRPPEDPSQTNDTQKGRNHANDSSDPKDLKLDINNKGMKLLLKMGWIQGNGLGVSQNGRREPIPTPAQTPLLGLGKATQDAYMLSNAISKPKELESLIIAREDEEAKVKREEKVKEIQTRVVEREDRLKTFHCHTCDKGYTTISQFEEHERSYAHHHAKRALEAKEARKATGRSTEAKLEKTRKREAKELERMARAARMSLDSSRSTVSVPKPQAEPMKNSAVDGFKKPSSGWTKLVPSSSTPAPNTASTGTGSQIVNQDPLNPSFTNNKTTEGNDKGSSTKFKSSGFAPISASGSSGFKPISRTNTETNPPSTSRIDMPAPKFVTSSLDKQSDSKLTTDGPTMESTPAPQSKFAQIAARLAAKKASSALASSASMGTQRQISRHSINDPSNNRPSSTDKYSSEIEKMLDL